MRIFFPSICFSFLIFGTRLFQLAFFLLGIKGQPQISLEREREREMPKSPVPGWNLGNKKYPNHHAWQQLEWLLYEGG